MNFEALAGAIIHDLKNQLQSVVAESERMLEQVPPEYHAAMQPFLSRTRRVHQDAMQLVTLYRLTQRGNFSSDDAWPADTARHAAECVSVHYPDVLVETDIDGDCQGFYNDFLIQMALTNLINNSAQAGATEIHITAEEQGPDLVIRVEDNGPGFSETQLEGDFGNGEERGTGMGLYFNELIMKHHSRPGRPATMIMANRAQGGACVTLTLP